MNTYELGVIGAGNMAEAILRGALGADFLTPQQVIAADPDGGRREAIAELGVTVTDDNTQAAKAKRILLAVKPQAMPDVLAAIREHVHADALVISIAAGVTCAALDEGLKGRGRIVRVMPNTPMLVGEGASAVAAGPRAHRDDATWAVKLCVAGGGLGVKLDEEYMDAVTAVSGSGPAYVFYLIEAMVEAGRREGLDEKIALRLATQTCAGAAALLHETGENPAELRRRVTSKGGTTQRAIETLDAAGVKDSLIEAIQAAAERSRELGE